MFCCQCGCVPEGQFPPLTGLQIPHLYNVRAVTDIRRLTTQLSPEGSHESMILILRSLLNFPTGEGLPYSFIQQTFMGAYRVPESCGNTGDQERHSPCPVMEPTF